MNILNEIKSLQENLTDTSRPISSAILRANLLAKKLEDVRAIAWLEQESLGYGSAKSSTIPEYRLAKTKVRFVKHLARHKLPDELMHSMSCRKLSQSVLELEELLAEKTYDDLYVLLLPNDEFLHGKVEVCLERRELKVVLEKIRKVLIDWSVALEKTLVAKGYKHQGVSLTVNNINGVVWNSQIQQASNESSQAQKGSSHE